MASGGEAVPFRGSERARTSLFSSPFPSSPPSLTLSTPRNPQAIYHDVGGKQMRPPTGPLRRQWGGEIVDLISTMWAQQHTDRPSMTQVVIELGVLVKAEKAKAKRR